MKERYVTSKKEVKSQIEMPRLEHHACHAKPPILVSHPSFRALLYHGEVNGRGVLSKSDTDVAASISDYATSWSYLEPRRTNECLLCCRDSATSGDQPRSLVSLPSPLVSPTNITNVAAISLSFTC